MYINVTNSKNNKLFNRKTNDDLDIYPNFPQPSPRNSRTFNVNAIY